MIKSFFIQIKKRSIQIILLSLFISYMIFGFLIIPLIIESKAKDFIKENYNETLVVDSLFFNPFNMSLTIEGLNISHSKKDSVDFDQKLQIGYIHINIDLLPLLWKEIKIQKFDLKQSKINFAFYSNQKNIWSSLKPSPKEEKKNDSPWTINFKEISLQEDSFGFKDFNYPTIVQFSLGPISLKATDLKTSLNHDSIINDLNISFANNGHLKLSGNLKLNPVALNLNLLTTNVPLDLFSAYLSKTTLLEIQSGTLSLKNQIRYNNGALLVEGNGSIQNFKLVRQDQKENVLSFDKIFLNHYVYDQKNNSFKIDELTADKLDTFIHLLPNGKLSYSTLLKDTKEHVKEVKKEEKPFAFSLNKFILNDSHLQFQDSQINPHFMANINSLNGEIGPLLKEDKTNIDLNGKVEAQGIFKAKGFFNKNISPSSLGLNVFFHNIEMTTFTPYSGHFAGYQIKKGKLFLNLDYSLGNNRIVGKNDVRFDQLTLGDKVSSKNATNLPVKFALALLKDRNGQIKFNLPVEGNPNAPKFSLGSMIRTALYNMLVNIINAPFDFLASLVGAGPEIKDLNFEPTQPVFKENEINKLDAIAKILQERPEIEIEIQSRAKKSEFKEKNPNDILIEELNQLSIKRANLVMESLIQKGISAEKIYILNPSTDENDLPGVSLILKTK